jgi:hypothetical protein
MLMKNERPGPNVDEYKEMSQIIEGRRTRLITRYPDNPDKRDKLPSAKTMNERQ